MKKIFSKVSILIILVVSLFAFSSDVMAYLHYSGVEYNITSSGKSYLEDDRLVIYKGETVNFQLEYAGEDQTVTGCELLYDFDGTANFDNGICVIKLNHYGRFELKITLETEWGEASYVINGYSIDDDFFASIEQSMFYDRDMQKYELNAFNRLGHTNEHINYNSDCSIENGEYVCKVNYYVIGLNSRETSFKGKIYGFDGSAPNQMSVGNYSYLDIYGDHAYEDIVVLIEDESVVAYSDRLFTALKEGKTKIYVIDTKMESIYISDLVVENPVYYNLEFTQDYVKTNLSNVPNVLVLDANAYNNAPDYTIKDEVVKYLFGEEFVGVNYSNISVWHNTSSLDSSLYDIYISYYELNTNDWVEYTIPGVKFEMFGIYIDRYLTLGEGAYFENFVQKYSSGEITYQYNDDEFKIEDSFVYGLKPGCFDFTAIVGDYSTTSNVCVSFGYEDNSLFKSFNNSNNIIELSYSKNDFKNNLSYLEKEINSKYSEIIPEKFKDFVTIKTYCINTELCMIKTESDFLEVEYYYKTISYQNTDNSHQMLPNIIENLNDVYVLMPDDYIKLLNAAKGDEDEYFNKMVDVLNLDELLEGTNITISIVNKKYYNIENNLFGNYSFTLNLINNSKVIYSKDIAIFVNTYLHIPIEVEHTDEKRAEYFEDYLKALLNVTSVDCVVTNDIVSARINDEYNIRFGYTQEDWIEATSVSYMYTHYEVEKGDTFKIQLEYHPSDANYFPPAKYTSLNEDIISVDENGNVTALKNGFGKVTIECMGYYMQVVILVGSTMQEFLDSLVDDINTHVVITFGEYRSNGNYAIEYAINPQTFDYESGWYNYASELYEEGNSLYFRKWFYGQGENTEYKRFESKPVKITYELKGIDIEQEDYHLTTGEKVKVNISYTEGNNSNLYYRIENPDIVSFDINGNLKGLKPGITRVDIYAKKESYNNYFYAYVDEEKYIENILENFENNGVVVDGNYAGWSISDGVRSKVNEKLNAYFFNPNINCDEEKKICHYELELNNKTYKADIPYTIEGVVYNGAHDVDLEVNDTYQLDVTNYTANKNKKLTYSTLEPNVCTISSTGLVTAKSAGFCPVLIKNANGSSTSVSLIVDRAKLEQNLAKEYSKIPNSVDIKLTVDVFAEDHGDITEGYYIYLNEVFRKYMGEGNYYFSFSMSDLKKENSDGTVEVSFSKSFNYEKDDNYWGFQLSTREGKRVKFNFLDKPVVADKNLEKIKEAIKHDYDLTMVEALTYRFSNRDMGSIVNYCSEFNNSIRKYKGYDYYFDSRLGSGSSEISATEGGFVVVTYNGAPVYVDDAIFTARYYLPSDAPQNQIAFMEYLIKVIKDAYIEIKNNASSTYGVGMIAEPRMALYTRVAVEEPVVEVEYVKASGTSELYWVTIDGEGFGLEVTRDENTDYPDMATNITLSKKDITLNQGESAKITYTLEPVGAQNAKVYWYTSNANVAKVENGQIVAIGAGTAVVTASVDGVSATVNVKVNNLKLDVLIKEEGYQVTTEFVHGFKLNETITSLQNKFGSDIKIEGSAKVIGTGTKFTYNGQTFTAVVYGDLSGDGVINSADLLKMRQHLLGTGKLAGAYEKAAAVVNGETINSADLLRLRQHLLGSNIINQ